MVGYFIRNQLFKSLPTRRLKSDAIFRITGMWHWGRDVGNLSVFFPAWRNYHVRDHLCLLPQLNTRVYFSLDQEKRAVDMPEGSLVSGTLRTGYPVHSWGPSCSGPTALPSAAVVRKLMSAHHLLSWPLMIKWTYLGCKWQKSGQTGSDTHKRRTHSIPGKSKRGNLASCVSRAQKKQCHQHLLFSPSRVLLSSVWASICRQ